MLSNEGLVMHPPERTIRREIDGGRGSITIHYDYYY